MLDKVQEDRLKKLQAIRELGIDPYGHRYDTAEEIGPLRARFEKWEADNGGAEAAKAVQPKLRGDAAGRVMLFRDMGKMIFATIRDETGQVQIALRKRKEGGAAQGTVDDLSWKLAALLDLGDIIAVEGPMERTRTLEITIWAEKLTLLSKSLNPMPEKWHGLSDIQARYRQRYLDLASNPESMEVFKKRIAIIAHFRKTLQDKGFVEVETPMMQSVYGGAAARPFTTHHNALDMDLFMRISPELYLKRLLVGGMSKVFEINRNFRNEGIDTRHNPEFTMMELYQAYADYEVMMDITEELVSTAAEKTWTFESLRLESEAFARETLETQEEEQELKEIIAENSKGNWYKKLKAFWTKMRIKAVRFDMERFERSADLFSQAALDHEQGKTSVPFYPRLIDYTRPWPRKKYADLVKEYAGVDWKDEPAVRAKARELKIEDSNKDLAVVVNLIFEAVVEPELAKPDANGVSRPVFVIDYPAAICPLTRRKADDPSVALRFECFVAGMELANAYTELNDPAVQEENFRQQLRGEAANETMRVMDEDFVTALRHGMPPAGGLGIGIDRVIMLLTNRQSIRDVVLFPLLRTAE
jgi:lysyl-tRNA synthetase class 2